MTCSDETSHLWRWIPSHCEPSMRAYLELGRPVGSFLQAVIANDLMDAAFRADDENAASLRDYALLLRNVFPDAAYGSRHAYTAWVGQKGLSGDGA